MLDNDISPCDVSSYARGARPAALSPYAVSTYDDYMNCNKYG